MEAVSGKNISRLINSLKKNAPSYSMFYAVYLAECLAKKLHPECDFKHFELEGIKFKPYEHYTYFPKNIRSFKYEDSIMTFVINILGLYGNDSPFPRCYHEQVAIQQYIHTEGEIPLQNFLDIFNNRFYWLYYQAWKKYRFYLQINDEKDNRVLERIFSFIGQGPQFVRERPSINAYKLLQLSGILCNRIRNKDGLIVLLSEFFPHKIKITEFIPCMVKVHGLPKMGSRSKDYTFRLGKNSLLGRSILDSMSRICITIGPMKFDDYLDFLPKGENAKLLKELLKIYLNDGLEYDLECIIDSSSIRDVPWNDERVKMGQSFWLGSPKKKQTKVYFKYEKYAA